MKGPITNECHGKEKSDTSHFGRRISITVVKPKDLSISFSHQSSFDVINFAIRSNLNGTDQMTAHFFFPRRGANSHDSLCSRACILISMACHHPRWSSTSITLLGIVIKETRNKGKIWRGQPKVAKKIVNRMRIIGKSSIFANGNGPTWVITIRSHGIKLLERSQLISQIMETLDIIRKNNLGLFPKGNTCFKWQSAQNIEFYWLPK